jgi:3-deoxy-manno-octulosonate cytidylyltransferase (CMP-KDO synthetase)
METEKSVRLCLEISFFLNLRENYYKNCYQNTYFRVFVKILSIKINKTAMRTIGIIPARYASTRFPGKPLTNIGGKTMIQRVYEQVSEAKTLSKVVVATDDIRIFNHVNYFGGAVVMTAESHLSGTDRCAEVLSMPAYSGFDAAVNIQGDEPFIQPFQIDMLVNALRSHKNLQIGTLAKKIDTLEAVLNENIVKVIFDAAFKAIYFSRHPIPFVRGLPAENWLDKTAFYKHIGLYAFRSDALQKVAQLKPSRLEMAESLEQLRWLENGFKIGITLTALETIGIDTPEDVAKVQCFL